MFGENVYGMEAVYWICALGGSAFFVLRVMMSLVGGFGMGGDHDLSALPHSVDLPHDVGSAAHAADQPDQYGAHGTETTFKVLSLTSVSAFIMMFGWIGLSGLNDFNFAGWISFILACVAGFITMLITAYLFKLAGKLTSEGARYDMQELVGKQAQVYHRIPVGGKGRIQITVNGLLREVDALGEPGDALESFTNVTVTRVVDRETVCVKKNN
jgi:hypothetical protein